MTRFSFVRKDSLWLSVVTAVALALGGPAVAQAMPSMAAVGPTGASVTRAVSAAPAKAKAVIKVTVSGLPAKADLSNGPAVKLIGPLGGGHSKSWSVGRSRLVAGLAPGLYVVTAEYVVKKDGTAFAPGQLQRWVNVARGAHARVKVAYSAVPAGVIIPPPVHPTFQIDMDDACRYLTDDYQATASYTSNSNPYSWYCFQPSNRRTSGMDLDYYCQHRFEGPIGVDFTNAIHKGMDWYCE